MRHILFFIFIVFTFVSGEEELIHQNIYEYDIEVKEKGMDCGDVFLADILNDQEDFNQNLNTSFSRIYALNLDERHQITGLKIRVKLRKTEASEVVPCTTMGPTYPQIVIVELVEILN